MNKKDQPRFQGRFDSTITDIEIYDVVSAVAMHGKPEKPEAITVRAWSNARAGAGWPDAPTAHALCMRLGRGWREILHDALSPHRDHAQIEATRKQTDERSDLDYRHVRFAIRMVAGARGQDTLTPDEYMETREKIIAADRRRSTGGVLERLLPTANQIRWVMGNDEGAWQRAVADVAGLRAPRKRGRGPAKGMPIVDAYVLYVKVAGCRVAKNELIRFAADSGFKTAKREAGKPWSEYEREVAERLAKLGLAIPKTRLPKQAEPPIADPALIPDEYRRYEEAPVSDEDAIRALREYHGLLSSQTTRTQARYRQMVKQHPHWPGRSTSTSGAGSQR
jgi:hypothetical protein